MGAATAEVMPLPGVPSLIYACQPHNAGSRYVRVYVRRFVREHQSTVLKAKQEQGITPDLISAEDVFYLIIHQESPIIEIDV